MREPITGMALAALLALTVSCAGTTTSPVAPVVRSSGLAGTWAATTSDSQGPGVMKLKLTEAGNAISGTVSFNFTGAPGDCNSCHRQTTGTVTGTMTGSQVTFLMNFPFGDSLSATPMCEINIAATSDAVEPNAPALSAAYSGTDSCMGKFSDGTMTLTRALPPGVVRR